jgi:hypothetical protein
MDNSRIQEDLPDVSNPFVVSAKKQTVVKSADVVEKNCDCENKFEPYLYVSFMILLWYLTRKMRDRN